MVSISELACASSKGMELISTDWFGMSISGYLELCQSSARGDAGLEDGLRLNVFARRQCWQIVVGAVGPERHAKTFIVPADLSPHMSLATTCRLNVSIQSQFIDISCRSLANVSGRVPALVQEPPNSSNQDDQGPCGRKCAADGVAHFTSQDVPPGPSFARHRCSSAPPGLPTCAATAASPQEAECRGWRPR